MPHYHKVLEAVPSHFGAAYNLARAYQRLERRRAALEQFERALKINPQAAKIYYHLGELYGEMGRRDDMTKAWKTLLRLAPNHPQAENVRAVLDNYAVQEK